MRYFPFSFVLCSALLLSISSGHTTVAQQPDRTESEIDDLGRLPESFDMSLDSLLSARYKQSYTLNKGSQRHQHLSADDLSRDAMYRNRVGGMESAIPLTYNSIVREAIDLYVHKRSTLISNMLGKSVYYFPLIEEELDKHGLPLELKYLSIVESALNPTAVSRMGATGLWQFMLRTGKLYGLRIDSTVDERRDPRKSTQAMCLYFKDMYALYGDWLVAIAAYNCGPGNINKAIRRAGGSRDFWTIYPYLPRETRAYVPFFIAAFYAMEYHREHDIRPPVATMPLSTDTVHIDYRTTLTALSSASGVAIETLRQLNPQYHKDIVPGNQSVQVLVMPSRQAIVFGTSASDSLRLVAQANAIEALGTPSGQRVATDINDATKESATAKVVRYHKVKKGETLSSIAAKYRGVTVKSLKRANGLKSDRLKIGQRLIIP